MWRYVLPPVLLVAALWIAMSSATTFYVQWIEQSYRRVVDENVASIHAARALRRNAHRVESGWPIDDLAIDAIRPLWWSIIREMEEQEKVLQDSAHTVAEQEEIRRVSDLLDRLQSLSTTRIGRDEPAPIHDVNRHELTSMGRDIGEIVSEIGSVTSEFENINQRIIDDVASRQALISKLVFTARLALLLTGPFVGVWLGWRLSQRLHKSVARIAVTLQQSDAEELELGTVTLQSEGILSDVQQQAEKIVGRLRSAHRALEKARGELVRSERLAAVGQLAAGVAHELRNPMTSVKLLLQHAARHPNTRELTESKLQLILEEISRMESTIQGLLDFSRQRPLRRVRHDLCETVQRALNLIDGRARQQRVDVQVNNVADPFIVDADAEQLHQVFVNLLINAIEAMPEGGRLFVKSAVVGAGQRIRVQVRDSGTGIPDDILPRLFEPFTTTKERGTGLGLAVSRRIIDEHGGTLTAANHADGGAIFTIELSTANGDVLTTEYLRNETRQITQSDN